MQQKIAPYLPGILLFITAAIIGIWIYPDYGISWDEPIQRSLGNVTYNYVFNGDNTLLTYGDRAYGTAFELPLIFLEKGLKLNDTREIFLMRHIVTHLFFLLSAFCGYVLALRLFKSRLIACLGFLLLVMEPRIYAHSFFNSKDVPLLSAFLIAMLLCQVAFSANRRVWFFVMGLACGYATGIRAMGIILLPCIGGLLVLDIISALVHRKGALRPAVILLLFVGGFAGMLYCSWPFLWAAPVHNFSSSLLSLSAITSGGNTLFRGVYYNCTQLPLAYMPVWFGVTVPELWLLCGVTGFVWQLIVFVRRPLAYLADNKGRDMILYAVWFISPVVAIVVFSSANFDDWRHLYFIYPPFVMLALFVVHKCVQGRHKLIGIAACVLQLAATGYTMMRDHPFQQVYFNALVPHGKEYLRRHYDMEYWGCGYKQGLDYLAATNKSDSIKIYWAAPPLFNNIMMLRPENRKRIYVIDDLQRADYLITNFRGNKPVEYPDYKEAYSISRQNSQIMCIYKLH